MKKPNTNLPYISTCLCLFSCLCASRSQAQNQYFDINGATSGYGVAANGSYSWDAANWGVSGGTGATTTWGAGTFARFYGAATYTVTVNNDELMAGMYQNGGSGHNLTVNSAGSGALDIATGDQGFLAASGTTLTLNALITGSGGLAPESSGNIIINNANTYTGGTAIGYSGTPLTYFNNNNAFGSGTIRNVYTTASVAPLLTTGGTLATPKTITLANNFSIATAGAGFNFANSSYTPLVLTGDFALGTGVALVKNNGDTTAPLTLSGNLNNTGTLNLGFNNGGTIIVKGANAGLTGTVTIGTTGGQANGIVKLGAANTLSHAGNITLTGGTLDPNGLTHTMTTTTLTLGVSSKIDFGSGDGVLEFADSTGTVWSGLLNLVNFDPAHDQLRVGTDGNGLTSQQLADIEFNGTQLGNAQIDSQGYIVDVPEPSTVALSAMGGFGMLMAWMRKRKSA